MDIVIKPPSAFQDTKRGVINSEYLEESLEGQYITSLQLDGVTTNGGTDSPLNTSQNICNGKSDLESYSMEDTSRRDKFSAANLKNRDNLMQVSKFSSSTNSLPRDSITFTSAPQKTATTMRRFSVGGGDLDIKMDKFRDERNRRSSVYTLMEQRKKTHSKLRGLVIPEVAPAIDHVLLSDLPEIKSELSGNIGLLTELRLTKTDSPDRHTNLTRTQSVNSITDRKEAINLGNPPWKSQVPSNHCKYSPAFKRKSLTLMNGGTMTPAKGLQNQINVNVDLQNTSTTKAIISPRSNSSYSYGSLDRSWHSHTSPILSPNSLKSHLSEDSDGDSAVSSIGSGAGYSSPPSSDGGEGVSPRSVKRMLSTEGTQTDSTITGASLKYVSEKLSERLSAASSGSVGALDALCENSPHQPFTPYKPRAATERNEAECNRKVYNTETNGVQCAYSDDNEEGCVSPSQDRRVLKQGSQEALERKKILLGSKHSSGGPFRFIDHRFGEDRDEREEEMRIENDINEGVRWGDNTSPLTLDDTLKEESSDVTSLVTKTAYIDEVVDSTYEEVDALQEPTILSKHVVPLMGKSREILDRNSCISAVLPTLDNKDSSEVCRKSLTRKTSLEANILRNCYSADQTDNGFDSSRALRERWSDPSNLNRKESDTMIRMNRRESDSLIGINRRDSDTMIASNRRDSDTTIGNDRLVSGGIKSQRRSDTDALSKRYDKKGDKFGESKEWKKEPSIHSRRWSSEKKLDETPLVNRWSSERKLNSSSEKCYEDKYREPDLRPYSRREDIIGSKEESRFRDSKIDRNHIDLKSFKQRLEDADRSDSEHSVDSTHSAKNRWHRPEPSEHKAPFEKWVALEKGAKETESAKEKDRSQRWSESEVSADRWTELARKYSPSSTETKRNTSPETTPKGTPTAQVRTLKERFEQISLDGSPAPPMPPPRINRGPFPQQKAERNRKTSSPVPGEIKRSSHSNGPPSRPHSLIEIGKETDDDGEGSNQEIDFPGPVGPSRFPPIQHDRMSSMDSTTSEESSLRDLYGSVTSLASSTSLISPQELQQLIDEANQSATEEGGTPNQEINVVVLHREPGSPLGLTLAGGADLESKEITVHRVIAGSLADRDGRLTRGDRVISINGKSLRGLTHREALQLLKQPRAEVVLVISRSRSSTPADGEQNSVYRHGRPPKILESPVDTKSLLSELAAWEPPRGDPITVSLRKEGSGLGFSLEGGKDSPHGDRALTVKKIFTGGVADKQGEIKEGDEIVSINTTDMTGMTRIQAWNFMKRLPEGAVTLVIRHRLQIKALPPSLTNPLLAAPSAPPPADAN